MPSDRLWPGDIEAWRRLERCDALHAKTRAFRRRCDEAQLALQGFVARGECYAGVSWGKDSVVVAHLVRMFAPRVPLVWVTIGDADNPDCAAVRDAFLAAFPGPYDEVHVEGVAVVDGELPTGARAPGFRVASERYGGRHVSGVRGDESSARSMRMARWGHSTLRTCAPIGRWTAQDVFAYLHLHNLPVHPVYAMTMGGRLDRSRLRVASLGGKRGTGMGRREWERAYYRDVLRGIEVG